MSAGGTGLAREELVLQLREALQFEQEQLHRLQAAVASQQLNPVQAANWPALVRSHERSIETYKARLADLEKQ